MRIKRRKIPLDVILATPVSEARRKHGMQVYAARLCHRGQYDKAKEYCVKNNLSWPPFSGVPIFGEAASANTSPPAMATGVAPSTGEATSPEPLSDGAREAGPVAREEAKPREVAIIGVNATSESLAGATHGAERDASTGDGCVPPHELGVPALREAIIWGTCNNPRLMRIKFVTEDGKQEFGSMWASRANYRINEPVEVQVERGSGASAIWQEVRRPV